MKICLISPGHLGSNPRLVKEADALFEAGHDIHVIYGETHQPACTRDKAILASRQWKAAPVSLLRSSLVTLILKVCHRTFLLLFSKGILAKFTAAPASHPLYPLLLIRAKTVHADHFIGHCLPALPVAVKASQRSKASCSFDAEDFHSGEAHETPQGLVANRLARSLESQYLKRCSYLTAASPLISNAYQEHYGVRPTTILNVFPKERQPSCTRQHKGVSLYWFSQTIGPGRGLEPFIEQLLQLEIPVQVDLRGHCSEGYQNALLESVKGSKVSITILEPASPDDMIQLCAGYTAGLALEQSTPFNRDICLTNKAFTYLLAGIPVIFSKTSAQVALDQDLGDASILIDLDSKGTDQETHLSRWLTDPTAQEKAKAHALSLGQERYNWDIEKRIFLSLLPSAAGALTPS